MAKICIISGRDEAALAMLLSEEHDIVTLIPIYGTTLPSQTRLLFITESACANSLGARHACRKMLLGAVCGAVPAVFLLMPGADSLYCDTATEMLQYCSALVCRRSEAIRVLGAPGVNTEAVLLRRFGLDSVRVLQEGASAGAYFSVLPPLCRLMLKATPHNSRLTP